MNSCKHCGAENIEYYGLFGPFIWYSFNAENNTPENHEAVKNAIIQTDAQK